MRGSMYERRPGVWLLRVYTGQRDRRGNPVQRARTFHGGQREAETALSRFVVETVKSERQADAEGVTVARLLDRWLEHSRKRRTPQTIRGYENKIDGRLKPKLGRIRVDRLRAHHIDDAMTVWGEEGLSPATIRQLYAILAAALHQAHKWGWVDEIVTKRASPPSVRRKPASVPSQAELQALIDTAETAGDGVLAAAVALAAVTGCRRGELCALRWSDVNLESGVLSVGRSLGWVERVVEGDTKTHQARRLALGELGLGVVQQRMLSQQAQATEAEVSLAEDPYLLSRSVRGDLPCLPDGLTHAFGRLCGRLGMSYHFHQLRHWAATMAIAGGHDIRTVAGRLGHADASTTLRIYSHVLEARDHDLADSLGRALNAGR